MTVSNLKDLEAVIKLCRRTGIESITVDGIQLVLGNEPQKPAKPMKSVVESSKTMFAPTPGVNYTPGEDTQIPVGLTDEQLLYYSVGGVSENE